MSDNIYELLQERRIEMKLSIQQLSKESGISASHISRIERGVRNPSSQTLEKLANPLNVEYITLLKTANLLGSPNSKFIDLEKTLENEACVYQDKEIPSHVKDQLLSILNNYVEIKRA